MRFSYKHFCAACVLFALMLLARCPALLLQAQPWAEDGTIFISRSLSGQLWQNYAGYFHAFPQLCWALALKFFPNLAPHFCALANLLLAAMIPAYFLLPHWEKLFTWRLRLGVALAWILAMPHTEVYLGVLDAYLHFTLGAGLLLCEQIFIPEMAQRNRWLKRAYVLAAGLSSPGPFQLLAGSCVFLFVSGKIREGLQRVLQFLRTPLPALLLLLGLFQIYVFLRNPGPPPGVPPLFLPFPLALLHAYHMRILLPWFVGNAGIELVNESGSLSLALFTLTVASLYLLWSQRRNPPTLFLGILCLLYTSLYFVARPEFYFWFTRKLWGMPLQAQRVWYVPSALTLLMLANAWQQKQIAAKRFFTPLLVLSITLAAIKNFSFNEFKQPVLWAQLQQEVARFQRQEISSLELDINPWDAKIRVLRDKSPH